MSEYLTAHAEHDGRGVTVAVLDTGVDPGAAGLRRTSDGRVKVVDIIDCTASGDVALSGRGVVSADGRSLTGITGRTLRLTNEMRALAARGAVPAADGGDAPHPAAGEWRLGVASAARLFPGGLASRISAERRVAWEAAHRDKLSDIRRRKAAHAAVAPPTGGGAAAKAYKVLKEELVAAEALLVQANAPSSAAVYDVVAFWDGTRWRVVVDTSEAGDLSSCPVLEDYRVAQRYGSFGDRERVHFGVNVYDDGAVVSVVVESGYHGTHVAGIVAGNYPDAPERNGVAPGAQIVSLKIGDSRIDGMETHQGLVRALAHLLPASLEDPSTPPHAAQHKVVAQVANMSYGEATPLANTGRVVQLLTALAREAGVLFLSSAGNAGPGLSTVGAPGGTTDAVIGVGAYVTPGLATQAYSLLPDGLVYPSPGALSADGYPPAPEGLTGGLTGGGAASPTSGMRVKSELTGVKAPTGSGATATATATTTATNAAGEEVDDELPLGVPYTFTSRGPCADGSLGVSISAPGGAVAASSSWMLRKKLLLNGTSMSCPSAAGAAAVVLSARPSTSVARLRRAIENGAAAGLRPAFFWAAAGASAPAPEASSSPVAAAGIGNGARVGNGTGRMAKAPAVSTTAATDADSKSDDALTACEMAFSAGRGSISVPRTIAYLDAYAKCVEEDWRFAVSVTDSSQRAIIRARGSSREYGRGRGVYLRAGGHECRSVSKWLVHLDVANDALPDRSAAAAEMVSELELDISLVPSAPWISAPAGVRLYGGGRQFPIAVDPTGLAPGRMHYGEVAGYMAPSAGAARPTAAANSGDWAEPRGPLFRVPVTVVKPLLLAGGDGGVGSLVVENLPLTPGGVVRTFVLPPAAATFARVALVAGTADEFLGPAGVAAADSVISARTVQLHAVQIVPGSAPGGPRHVFTLSPDGVGSVIIPVSGGVTMELALAQLWSSAGACTVRRLEVTFSGLSVNPSMLSVGAGAASSPSVLLTNQLPQGGSARRLTVDASDEVAYAAAAEAAERGTTGLSLASEAPPVLAGVGVKASMMHASRVLPPRLAMITALPRDRDLLPDARCIYQLELEYTLSLSASESSGSNNGVDVAVVFPGLNHAVYNSEVEGGPYVMVYDSNGKLVHTSDIYPSFASLSVKGTYTIRAFVRHERMGLLEALTDLCATVSMKLASAISLDPYGSAHAAALAAGADGGVGSKLAISSSGRTTLAPGASLAFWLAPPKKASLPKWVATGDKLVGNLVVDRVLAPDGAVRAGTISSGLAKYGLTWVVSPTMSGEKTPKTERASSGPAGAKSAATTKSGESGEKVAGQASAAATAAAVDGPSTSDSTSAADAPKVAAAADAKDEGKNQDVASWVTSQLSDARVGVMKKVVKEANGANLSDAPTHLARFTALADSHLAEKANDTVVLLMRLQLVDSVAQRRVAAAAAATLGVSSPDAAALAPIAGGEDLGDSAGANVIVSPPSIGAAMGSDPPDWAAVVAAADGVVGAVDATALAAHFGTRVNADDEAAVAERKRQDTTRSTLIEALFRKARATAAVATTAMVAASGSTVAPPLLCGGGDAAAGSGAAAEVAAFEEAFTALAAWADVSAPAAGSAPTSTAPAASGGVAGDKAHASVSGATVADVALLVSARERLRGCPATALRALSGLAPPAVGGRSLAATTVERFALLAALGWADVEADARAAAAVAFPKFGERY